MNEQIFKTMAQSIIDGEAEEAEKLAKEAIESGIDPLEAINKGFVVGVDHVGDLFSRGEAFLPELVMAGEAMKTAVNVLEPEMAKQGSERKMLGTVVTLTGISMMAAGALKMKSEAVDIYLDGMEIRNKAETANRRNRGIQLIGTGCMAMIFGIIAEKYKVEREKEFRGIVVKTGVRFNKVDFSINF